MPTSQKRAPLTLPGPGLPGGGAPPAKRRKPSIASTASHPLRQTSFPPPDGPGGGGGAQASSEQYSDGSLISDGADDDDDEINSAVGSVAASRLDGPASSISGVASGRGAGGRGRGRGRGRGGGRGKGAGAGGRSRAETMSMVSGDGKGATPRGGAEGEEAEEEEDEGEEDGEELEGGGKVGRERLEEEKERRAMFLSSLLTLADDGRLGMGGGGGADTSTTETETTETQEMKALRKRKIEAVAGHNVQRYELWNRIHLKKEVVRRLTNQTLSQSVPQSVVTAISAYSKVFVGEIVDRALGVQMEWTAARLEGERAEKANAKVKRDPSVEIVDGPGHAAKSQEEESRSTPDRDGHVEVDERDLGPLLPDHLREALRRHKADREGGVVGFTGLSLEGRENTAARNGGKRLFR